MFQPVTIFGFTLPLISVILFGFAIVFLVAVQLARTVVSNKLTSLFESKLYDEFLEKPGKAKAHSLLHTTYTARGMM